jgi:serine/threonine protein kinase
MNKIKVFFKSKFFKSKNIFNLPELSLHLHRESDIDEEETEESKKKKKLIELVLNKKYKVIKKLGSGTFSDVYCIEKKESTELFTCKLVKKSFKYTEISIPNSMKNDKIIRILECIKYRDIYYLLSTYKEGMDLLDHLQNSIYNEHAVKKIIIEILRCLIVCEESGILHLDIKPENFLVKQESPLELILIDFGSAIRIKRAYNITNKLYGTVEYCPPENYKHLCYKTSDVWSVGIITYSLFTGTFPVKFPDNHINWASTLSKKEFSPYMIKFLKNTIEANPSDRLTAKELLQHVWLF